jgi:hypothetical protein
MFAPTRDPKRINFKGKNKRINFNPRKGICSKCGKKIGDHYTNCFGEDAILKRTGMHHLIYDESNPAANTIELCNPCHVREHKKHSFLKPPK